MKGQIRDVVVLPYGGQGMRMEMNIPWYNIYKVLEL